MLRCSDASAFVETSADRRPGGLAARQNYKVEKNMDRSGACGPESPLPRWERVRERVTKRRCACRIYYPQNTPPQTEQKKIVYTSEFCSGV